VTDQQALKRGEAGELLHLHHPLLDVLKASSENNNKKIS
jgi:hypothetical protein